MNYKLKIEAIENYVKQLEKDAIKLRHKESDKGLKRLSSEIKHLTNQSDANLIMDIVHELKGLLGVE